MALKATIFKAELQVSDLDRNYFATHSLTIARHPSETDERMMVRLLAFALDAGDMLEFGKGLSSEDEPDLVQRDLTGAIQLWIEVGLPDEREVRKACGKASRVKVYTYGRGATIWWNQNREALAKLRNVDIFHVDETAELTRWAARSMEIGCTIQDGQVYLSRGEDSLIHIPRKLFPEG
jgi:uncharacterized protein YaeQ